MRKSIIYFIGGVVIFSNVLVSNVLAESVISSSYKNNVVVESPSETTIHKQPLVVPVQPLQMQPIVQYLEDGCFDEAGELLDQHILSEEQAIERLKAELHQRQVNAAELQAANGDLNMVKLNYKEAHDYYLEAIRILPEGEDEKLESYLEKSREANSKM